ncbi:hypothetical protein [Pedobacter aquatilis]|uniref:hypothetical protein n=1 Tax=Pedobacter aquatilis TaxID=351343 RepID=UPI002931A2E7|nr:hypothetical protein [Pedobacter aquatilis]
MKISTIKLMVALPVLFAFCSCKKSDASPNEENTSYEVRKPTYQFNTTNWDDGWVSQIKDNWVEVNKGSVKVILHYPQASTSIMADPEPYVNNAWDILVAKRYSNLTGYKVVSPSLDYERAYLGYGTAVDNATGKSVFLALFKKGNSGWIEMISPDKNAFVSQFGVDPATITWSSTGNIWNSMRAMSNYNRFAVAVTDIEKTGEWSNNFGSNTYYYSMYTGLGVGMSSYSSMEKFFFTGSNTYQWQIFAANSSGGVTNTVQAKSAGNFNLPNNWSTNFSNIEGSARTYLIWFAATKDGRILFINGNPFTWVGKSQ